MKTATEAEILSAVAECEHDDGWGEFVWYYASVHEFDSRWRAWLATVSPEVTDKELLAAAQRFNQTEVDKSPEDFITWTRQRMARAGVETPAQPQTRGKVLTMQATTEAQ